MLRRPKNPDPAAAVLDHGQDIDLGAVEQVGGEEVQRKDPLRLGPQELRPAWPVPARRRIDPGALEHLPDRQRRHGDAKPGQLAMDPAVTPGFVLPGQPQHHRPHLAACRRAPGTAPARQARPPSAQDVAVPPHDRARGHDAPHHRQALDRQRPSEHGQPRPIRPRQPGMSPGPLTLGDGELMAQHQDLGVLPPRFPARQPEQRRGTGGDQEDQLQAHKPKIIPRPDTPRLARQAPDVGPIRRRSSEHLPRWHRFSARK